MVLKCMAVSGQVFKTHDKSSGFYGVWSMFYGQVLGYGVGSELVVLRLVVFNI